MQNSPHLSFDQEVQQQSWSPQSYRQNWYTVSLSHYAQG